MVISSFLKANLPKGKLIGLIIYDILQSLLSVSILLGVGITIKEYSNVNSSVNKKTIATIVLVAYTLFTYFFSLGYSFYKTKVALHVLNNFLTSSINNYSIIKRSSPDKNFKLYIKTIPDVSINLVFFVSNLIEAIIKFVSIMVFLFIFNKLFWLISLLVLGVVLITYVPYFITIHKRACLYPSNFSNEFLKYKHDRFPSNIKYLFEENEKFFIRYRPKVNLLKCSYQPFSTLVSDISLIIIILIVPHISALSFDTSIIFLLHAFLMLTGPIFLLLKCHKQAFELIRALTVIQGMW